MSAEQALSSTGDLRTVSKRYKRDAAHKHKWALGAIETRGRDASHPRPFRPSETFYNVKRRETKAAVASLAHGTKIARKHDMLEGTSASAVSDNSSDSNSDRDEVATSTAPDAGVMYSFDAASGPTHGSEILNSALAKAVERFEEKETVRLVKAEYDIVDSEGEIVGSSRSHSRSMLWR